jgi:hypothetical protein
MDIILYLLQTIQLLYEMNCRLLQLIVTVHSPDIAFVKYAEIYFFILWITTFRKQIYVDRFASCFFQNLLSTTITLSNGFFLYFGSFASSG